MNNCLCLTSCEFLPLRVIPEREWADFIFLNRNNKTTIPAHAYDIVYGPIANDRVGVQIGKYEAGDITLDQFLENLKYMKGITYQYYFGTERAIAYLMKI